MISTHKKRWTEIGVGIEKKNGRKRRRHGN
jgi:hypothetical protein